MSRLALLLFITICAFCTACTVNPVVSANQDTPQASSTSVDEAHRAILFVSMADGSIVRQSIVSDADYCFKVNGDSQTTCLTEGAAITDSDGSRIIAHQMVQKQLFLYANKN